MPPLLAAIPAAAAAAIPVATTAAGAIGGIAKSSAAQGAKDKATQLAAETARFSPWTHMNANSALSQAQGMQGANYLGDVAGGATSGMLQGENIWEKMQKQNKPKSEELIQFATGGGPGRMS